MYTIQVQSSPVMTSPSVMMSPPVMTSSSVITQSPHEKILREIDNHLKQMNFKAKVLKIDEWKRSTIVKDVHLHERTENLIFRSTEEKIMNRLDVWINICKFQSIASIPEWDQTASSQPFRLNKYFTIGGSKKVKNRPGLSLPVESNVEHDNDTSRSLGDIPKTLRRLAKEKPQKFNTLKLRPRSGGAFSPKSGGYSSAFAGLELTTLLKKAFSAETKSRSNSTLSDYKDSSDVRNSLNSKHSPSSKRSPDYKSCTDSNRSSNSMDSPDSSDSNHSSPCIDDSITDITSKLSILIIDAMNINDTNSSQLNPSTRTNSCKFDSPSTSTYNSVKSDLLTTPNSSKSYLAATTTFKPNLDSISHPSETELGASGKSPNTELFSKGGSPKRKRKLLPSLFRKRNSKEQVQNDEPINVRCDSLRRAHSAQSAQIVSDGAEGKRNDKRGALKWEYMSYGEVTVV